MYRILVLSGFMILVCLGFGNLGMAGNSEKIVMVSLFENLSKEKAIVQYEANTTSASLDFRRKTYSVDRYSEIPRTILEDAIIDLGANVVERQSLNKMLMEHKFISDSGLVDTTTALKIAKMLGANTLIVGSITDIGKEKKRFKGYGISTNSVVVTTNMRARGIDIETGKILFSVRSKGIAQISANAGEAPIYESIEDAVENIAQNPKFTAAFQTY